MWVTEIEIVSGGETMQEVPSKLLNSIDLLQESADVFGLFEDPAESFRAVEIFPALMFETV